MVLAFRVVRLVLCVCCDALGEIVRDGDRTYVYIGKTAALILPEDRLGREQIAAFVEEINVRRKK